MDPDDGVVRVSMVHYNTVEEVQKLVEALDRVLPDD
jgi:selenocysteine lyase/cysteine desulfurase